MQPLPPPSVVLGLLNREPASDDTTVALLLRRAAEAARHHTRGAGFTADGSGVEAEIAEVLVESVRRALMNPELSLVGDGDAFCLRPGSFADWSYTEYAVLERYRTGPLPAASAP
jgi:hypothetical protein